MNKNILLEDKLALTESELHTVTAGGSPQQNKTFRTRIDAFDQFGDPIFTRLENNVVLGGSIYVLEKLFNVRSGLQVDTLNNIMTINNATPAFGATANIPQDHCICLWGIGTGGSGDAIGTVKDVKFYEREIGSNGVSSEMIPFRVTDTELVGAEAENYWFKKELTGGKKGYFLKKFASVPAIKALWCDGVDGEDGTEVHGAVHNTDRQDAIEVFAEMSLHLTKKDVREYFTLTGDIEKARINTIALCAAVKQKLSDGTFDYSNVMMITKLNFSNEMLENKEITFRYRIYTN